MSGARACSLYIVFIPRAQPLERCSAYCSVNVETDYGECGVRPRRPLPRIQAVALWEGQKRASGRMGVGPRQRFCGGGSSGAITAPRLSHPLVAENCDDINLITEPRKWGRGPTPVATLVEPGQDGQECTRAKTAGVPRSQTASVLAKTTLRKARGGQRKTDCVPAARSARSPVGACAGCWACGRTFWAGWVRSRLLIPTPLAQAECQASNARASMHTCTSPLGTSGIPLRGGTSLSHARQNFGLLEVVLRLRDQALVQHGLELGELFLWVVTRHDH